jgi:uncharacterized protein (TIGR03437 family)
MKRAYLGALLFPVAAAALFGQPTSPSPTIKSVGNSASGAPAIESGSWVSIYGTNLATTTRAWQASDFTGTSLPTTIDNVTVLIDGRKAAVAYVSPGQLNVQAPADSASGAVPVAVTNLNGSATGSATLRNYAPAFFTFQARYVAARHNSDAVAVAPAGFFGSAAPSRPALPGESIQVYATGLGPTTPAVAAGQIVAAPAAISDLSQLRVTVGGTVAQVQYAGLVGPGLYQLNLMVPQEQDGDQPIVATISGVSTQLPVYLPIRNSVPGSLSVTVAPNNRTVPCGATLAFTAKVNDTGNQNVTWLVNGVPGGNATVGTISAAGVYTAPAMLPPSTSVVVTAISQQDSTAQASVTVNLENTAPTVASVSPGTLNPGSATITVNGAGFAGNAVVYLAGVALPTTVVSSTQLTATANVTMPVGRLAALKVANPNPGAATSVPLAVPVRVVKELMPYADAVRFLEMTTWGPTPQSVADLQTMGQQAWLAAQFAQPASTWPDPDNTTEGVSRLQTAFWSVALTGSDQLRQRAAFALAQILVVSANKDTAFQQMVSYQRLMGQYAFDTYRNLLNATTLNAAMGDYLDLVNNNKATASTAANENYARESMQLFTLGLVQLDPSGNAIVVNGSTVPEYDQATVANMAKVMTGWTYGETPGYASLWTNMPYYFGPMTPFEDHHDATAKTLNFPIPCTIAAGGTAESDLSAAFDCIFQQTNVAPNTSFRLIQRLVMSSPSPAYVGRVANVFQSSGGNLPSVITALLTDSEAQSAGSGKLAEPILYATGLVRALNATITSPSSLTGQAAQMGQTPLTPASVFSFFLPGYVIPNLTPTTVAPEFQSLNASTALARANFAWRVVGNGLSSGIAVDLSNLAELAHNPDDLVEAINQALFRGQMSSDVRAILTTAAGGSTNMTARVRSALYAAAASPQYQVQQ